MAVTACDVPEGSLLAGFGGPQDYRDCFAREVAGEVTLADYIERFYCSAAFRPERMVLGLIGSNASSSDARAVARGETDRFAVWEVIGRRPGDRKGASSSSSEAIGQQERPPAGPQGRGDRSADALRTPKTREDTEILLLSKDTNTASWLSVQPLPQSTRLLFGSWVGNLEQSWWRFMATPHQWYSRVLLESAARGF